jgi:hypothetical protein
MELTLSLFCGLRNLEKRMAVFQAYSDEGGGPGPRDVFLYSGYAASIDTWMDFTKAWVERVLESPTIPYLHMTEIRREVFQKEHNLSLRQVERKVSEACRVTSSTGGLSVVIGRMSRADFQDRLQLVLKANQIPLGLGVNQPDFICFLVYAALTVQHIYLRHPEVEKIDFIVSEKKKVTDNLEGFHNSLREFLRQQKPDLSELVGDLIPARLESRLPLQAADLFCWHLQRIYLGTATSEDWDNWERLGQTHGRHHPYSADDLGALAQRFLDSRAVS